MHDTKKYLHDLEQAGFLRPDNPIIEKMNQILSERSADTLDWMMLSDKLRALRGKQTLAQLSDKTGLSISFLSDLEHNRAAPSLRTLHLLGMAYQLSVVDILRRTEYDAV